MKNNIKQVRETLGLSQAKLAERMGVSQPTLCRMESGEHELRPATVDRVAAALGVHWADLLPWDSVRDIFDTARSDFEAAARKARMSGLTESDMSKILGST